MNRRILEGVCATVAHAALGNDERIATEAVDIEILRAEAASIQAVHRERDASLRVAVISGGLTTGDTRESERFIRVSLQLAQRLGRAEADSSHAGQLRSIQAFLEALQVTLAIAHL
jgi:hypothetical protein